MTPHATLAELNRAIHAVSSRLRITLVLKSYFDESYDGKCERLYCLGGYAARETDWISFDTNWAKKASGDVFHSADLVNYHGGGDFHEWPKDRRDSLVYSMIDTINAIDARGFHCAIPLKEFYEVFPNDEMDAPYFLCFQLCLGRAAEWAAQLDDEVACFFDLNDEYEYRACRMFRHLKTLSDRPGLKHLRRLSSITFGSKKTYTPLQAADLIAYTGFRLLSERRDGRGTERLWWMGELGKKKNVRGELWGKKELLELKEELRIADANGTLPRIIKGRGEAR
jgi:hypothetical protein